MNWWLTRLLANRDASSVDQPLRDALAHWQALEAPDLAKPHFETRYVVLNTEATGYNVEKDSLIAVAGIAIEAGAMTHSDSYYTRLAPDPSTALTNLLTFCGKGPVVVFNAAINRVMLEHEFSRHLGLEPDLAWIDLYWLLPAMFSETSARPTKLADWMEAFGVETFQRLHALGDAYAIAQLMLVVEAYARRRGLTNPGNLADMEQSLRQLIRP